MAENKGEPQRLKDVTILAQEVARLVYEHPMDIWEYKRLSDEEQALLYATIRGQMVHAASSQYPGHLFAFTDPVVEKPEGEFTIAEDKVIGQAVVIRCHAFVWAPTELPNAPAPVPTFEVEGLVKAHDYSSVTDKYAVHADGDDKGFLLDDELRRHEGKRVRLKLSLEVLT